MSTESHSLYLGQKGRILLPASLRTKWGLKEGDRLVATLQEDGQLTLVPAKLLAQKLLGCMNKSGKPTKSVEDLLKQRKTESNQEIEEWKKRNR